MGQTHETHLEERLGLKNYFRSDLDESEQNCQLSK